MAKRGIISSSKIRFSPPGVDVDTAQPHELLMHEQFLFTQPYFFRFVACPFAGNTSTSLLDQTVSVTIPNVTPSPIVLLWPVDSDESIAWPRPRDETGGWATNWTVYHEVMSSTRLDVRFIKGLDSQRSPNGAYVVLMRNADA